MSHKANSVKSIKFILFIVVMLAIVQVIMSNRLVSLDTKLVYATGQVTLLERENEDLRQEVASSSALSTIEQRAEQQGLVKNKRFYYLSRDYPLALDRRE